MPGGAVRLALAGAGRWGRNYIRTIAALDNVELVAVASRNAETATLVPAGCRVVEDWRLLMDAGDVDGVIIASPPDTHADILIAAVEHGRAVLVEKPVVMSRIDAARIRARLDGRQTILVGHTHLFHPAFRTLCREAAALGPVRSIRSSAGHRDIHRRDASVLWDWAPHDLAMCMTLLPGAARVEAVKCVQERMIDGVAAQRIVIDATFRVVPANITVGSLDERHRWFAACFESCTLVFRDFVDNKLVRFAPGADITAGSGTPIAVSSELPLTRQVLDFAHSVSTRDTDRRSIDLGLSVVDLIADAEVLLSQGETR